MDGSACLRLSISGFRRPCGLASDTEGMRRSPGGVWDSVWGSTGLEASAGAGAVPPSSCRLTSCAY